MENYTSYSEKELFLMTAENDEAAFRQLYDRHASKIYSIAFLYLKSAVLSQDMVQEVFIKVWLKRKELYDLDNFSGWLHIVAKNLIISHLRKKTFEAESIMKDAKDKDNPEDHYVNKETAEIIHDAIRQLSPRQQQVYKMGREQGMPHSEIAKELNISQETVKEHMKQALRNMRTYLKEHLGILIFLF
ncbi:MAG TPA: RNA polymerase sigma-70 factor [Chitinophagaceae bacterium]|nr:RNA polymerase sigma-70 factor [Chitinophagaceae bacterium]